MAEAQGVPMLGLRTAMSEARLGFRLGTATQAASRVRSALSKIVEPDGSLDLLDAGKLLAEAELGANA